MYYILTLLFFFFCNLTSQNLKKLHVCVFFPRKWVSIEDNFLDSSGCPFLHPPLSAGTVYSLIMYRPCTCCHSLFEFICASILFFLEDTVSFLSDSCSLSVSSFTQLSQPYGQGFYEDITFRIQCSKFSHSLNIVQLLISMFIPIYCRSKLL